MADADAYDLYAEGRRHLADGEHLRAMPLLEKAREVEPDKGSIREALAMAYLRARRFRDAQAELDQLVDLSPNDHYAYFLLGLAQEGLGEVARATGSIRLATLLRPSSEEYARALARLEAVGNESA